MIKFRKHLSEPWFSFIKNNKKTVEGRLKKGSWMNIKMGDEIVWYNDSDNKIREFKVVIIGISYYDSFKDMLLKEKLLDVLPNIKSIKDGVNIYHKYYSEEDEEKFGVVALKIKVTE